MSMYSIWGLLRRVALVVLLAGTASCATYVRVPLAVPLPAVGGSRPATPQGFQLIGAFGDGLWGQEQERAEMRGVGAGFAVLDRFEFSISGYRSTRAVQVSGGSHTPGEATTGVRAKIRLGDFKRVSAGIHLSQMTSQRQEGDAQNERLTAWDVALPLEVYPLGSGSVDHRYGVYAAPRVLFQTFEDRRTGETTKGTLAAALLGVAARWRYLSVTGEMNLARTPTMRFGDATFESGWMLLPMASVSGILPIGD
jgi:hypothetical protein